MRGFFCCCLNWSVDQEVIIDHALSIISIKLCRFQYGFFEGYFP